MKYPLPLFCLAAVILGPVTFAGSADAASVEYRVAGTLAPSEAVAAEAFELSLRFDDPQPSDFEFVSFDAESLTADAWSLSLTDPLGPSFATDSAAMPGSPAVATYTGELTGGNTGQTRLNLSVIGEAAAVDVEFLFPDRLEAVLFTRDPADLIGNPLFVGGDFRTASAGSSARIDSARLEITRTARTADGSAADGAVAVPNPSTAVGGLLLMLCLFLYQNDRARRAATHTR